MDYVTRGSFPAYIITRRKCKRLSLFKHLPSRPRHHHHLTAGDLDGPECLRWPPRIHRATRSMWGGQVGLSEYLRDRPRQSHGRHAILKPVASSVTPDNVIC